jgi:hypothetical protein
MMFSAPAAKPPIELFGHAEMGGGAVSLGAEHADRMRVVDRQCRAVLLGDAQQGGEVGDVTFHRVDPVHDQHRPGALGDALQFAVEPGQVAVVEPRRLPVRHLGAVDDRGVVELVEEDHIAAADEPRNDAQIRLVARREDEARFLAEELRQLGFELLMEIQRAVQEPAPRAPRAVALQRAPSRPQHFRMMREPQVVVGAHHDAFLALDDDDRVLGAGNRLEVRVQPGRLHLAGAGEVAAFVEQRDVLQRLCAHEPS